MLLADLAVEYYVTDDDIIHSMDEHNNFSLQFFSLTVTLM